ncbi:hypothetical protein QLX08_002578 [Tetragonisca angustula]|uniref:Uncharacterized protein n=1 Tax=Tetragonisca angustula TaxID=166442 RepID=A0AAW1AA96_9HYME
MSEESLTGEQTCMACNDPPSLGMLMGGSKNEETCITGISTTCVARPCVRRPQHLGRQREESLPLQFEVSIIGRPPGIESNGAAFVVWRVTTSNEAVTKQSRSSREAEAKMMISADSR